MQEGKTIKDIAREAKQRMKSGFWQNYKKDIKNYELLADSNGVERSKVVEFYSDKIKGELSGVDSENEKFYSKVKQILDEMGEVPDIIGRLTDRNVFNTLNYEEKQRYTLNLSEKYLTALKRYKKEKELKIEF